MKESTRMDFVSATKEAETGQRDSFEVINGAPHTLQDHGIYNKKLCSRPE